MRAFEFDSVEQSYPELLKALLTEGTEVSPRGQLTKEITPVSITINNPRKRVIPSKVRKLNFGFMCAELLWILEGSNDVEFIGHYNSIWKRFTDDGETLNGAYGKRIFGWDSGIRREIGIETKEDGSQNEITQYNHVTINQFQEAYNQLKKDPDTRQATIVFFDPYLDYTDTKDKPCTNLIRFMIRDGKLNMTTFMRSNDIWLGYPYDVFNFTMLQEIMAGMLGIEVGKYTHIADSFHIYEMHFETAQKLIEEKEELLYSEKLIDARIDENDIGNEFDKAFNVEYTSRTNTQVDIEILTKILDEIKNDYLRSISAVLALYNFRKYGRTQEEMDILKGYISNEFKILTSNWVAK